MGDQYLINSYISIFIYTLYLGDLYPLKVWWGGGRALPAIVLMFWWKLFCWGGRAWCRSHPSTWGPGQAQVGSRGAERRRSSAWGPTNCLLANLLICILNHIGNGLRYAVLNSWETYSQSVPWYTAMEASTTAFNFNLSFYVQQLFLVQNHLCGIALLFSLYSSDRCYRWHTGCFTKSTEQRIMRGWCE